MNKFYLFLSVIGMSFAASAQSKGNIEFGFTVGYNSSTVSTSNGYYGNEPDSYSSFNAGASADFFFSDRWSIKVKALYDGKGFSRALITLPDGNNYITDVKLNYITVPVMANWHFGSKRNWYLNFGPYVGFLTTAKDTRFSMDLKNNFKSTDAGLAFGIGVKVPLNDKIKIFFEFDGQGGFSNIIKDKYRDYDYNSYSDGANVNTIRSAFNVGLNFML